LKTKITVTVIAFILALVLCGAVAANETSDSPYINQSDNVTVNTEISGDLSDPSEDLSDPYNPRLNKHYYGANGIADALNDPLLLEGDTIEVESGTYNFLTINTRVNLIATESNAVIQGIQIGSLSPFTGANYLVITGFVINNTLGPGIQVNNVDGVKILNNDITGNLASGISLKNTTNVILDKNRVYENCAPGIVMKDSSNNQVTDNVITSNDGPGPSCPGVYLMNSSDNTISGNTIQSNGGAGVSLEDSSDNTVTNNQLLNNDGEGVLLTDSNRNQIDNNEITGNTYAGIFLREKPNGNMDQSTGSNSIFKNNIHDNNLEGIRIEGSPYNEIYNNNIENNGNDGISINFAEENIIGTDNQILDNHGNGIYISSSPSTLIISNNIAGNTRNQIEVSEEHDGEGQDGVGGGEGQVDNGIDEKSSNDNIDNGSLFTYVHFNRIIATSGNFAILNTGRGIVYAELNWWGSNNGPTPEQDVGRDVIYDPWLVMRFSANPTTIQQGDTSSLLTDFRYDSNGVFHDPAQGDGGRLPTGLFVKFTTTLGNVGSKETYSAIIDSVARATLQGNEAAGNAVVGTLFDNQPLSTIVTIRSTANATAASATTGVSTMSKNVVGMQNTGMPLLTLLCAVFMVLGGFILPRRK